MARCIVDSKSGLSACIPSVRKNSLTLEPLAKLLRQPLPALENWVYPGFPTLFWGLSVFFVGDLMGKALWKLVENAARFPRRGGRVLCVHGAVSFHRAHLYATRSPRPRTAVDP